MLTGRLALVSFLVGVMVPLLAALIAGGVALYLGRPSKVATKAASIIEVAMERLERELMLEREAHDEHRRECTAQVAECRRLIDVMSTEIVRLGGNLGGMRPDAAV